MVEVAYLLTVVDLDDTVVPPEVRNAPMLDGPPPETAEPGRAPVEVGPRSDDPREMSLSTLHLAVLDDGRRVRLLDDRGWSSAGGADIWAVTSAEEIEADARAVVGPDEPSREHSRADMVADHWAQLAHVLAAHDVHADAETLSRLPHQVELSARVHARLRR